MKLKRRLTLTDLAREATLLSRKRFSDDQQLNITQMRNALACLMTIQGGFLRQFVRVDPVYRGYVRKYCEQCEAKAVEKHNAKRRHK